MTALHGFLGLPRDWDLALPEGRFEKVVSPNWLPEVLNLPGGEMTPGLPLLAERLNAAAMQTSDVLLGYSMGGRIALHMLVQDRPPFRWRKAIIVSASPGLSSPQERQKRSDQDRVWAERFRLAEWSGLMESWEAQAVFAGEPPMERDEREFDRGELAAALLRGSVGGQQDLRPALSMLEIPVLWLAGERDAKYSALAEECAGLNPRFTARVLKGGGHRAPWSCPEGFQAAVSEFLGK